MAELSNRGLPTEGNGGHVTDLAAELALGILPDSEAEAAKLHVRSCPKCAAEVASLTPIADRLLEMVPGTEPPLGFDRRVMAKMAPSDVRRLRFPHMSPRLAVLSAAAAAALVFGWMGWMAGQTTNHHHAQISASLVSHGHQIGEVETYGHPAWLTVSVHGVDGASMVTCEIVHRDGSVSTMGSFDLVKGSGTWSTPDPSGLSGASEARLVDATGQVLAVARF
jgi:anti-sigma factor RsiW